jgi:uncharacterized membrane protein (UPF0127 family)
MKILNKRTKKPICSDCETAETPLSQILGLMFSKKKNILFVFNKSATHPIHSLFVFFNFHAIYLDENMRVVDSREVRPFNLFHESKSPASYLLELCDGYPPKEGEVLCLDGKS